jgi:AraC-like DNA-binding protein
MKVLPFKISKPDSDAIVYQEDHQMVFYDKYHQHEEIQVSCIVEGEGTLIVGDTINYYKKGDIIVIGSKLPHVFKSDPIIQTKSFMRSLFFTRDAFGDRFFDIEELRDLHHFFKRAENGFMKTVNTSKLTSLFSQINGGSKFDRFLILMQIMKKLSKSNYIALSTYVYEKQYSDVEGKRMGDIMEYTMNNYHRNISLSSVAHIAAMTKNAFCKYFKKRTNKTYFTFLNELRIETASKLLLQNNELTIPEIAEQCGFNNISNFNRQFKSVKQLNPTAFKKIRQ